MALSDKGRRWPLLLSAAGLAAIGGTALAQAGLSSPEQAAVGATAYAQNCAACHGSDLTNGQFAPPLKGPDFLAKWGGEPVGKLLDYIHASMPPTNPGGLPDGTYAAIAAFILQQNGGKPGDPAMLPPAPAQARGEGGVGGLSTRVYPLPPGPKIPDRFAGFRPVTEAELDDPAPENWPAWRRSHLGRGYSPLKQIDTSNVGKLTIAWAQALPPGINMNEPLVRDGVLYVFGFGDNVFAFDAASGRQQWRYQRKLAQGAQLNSRKTIALYGDKLYTATSDNHMLALDAKSGRPVWDVLLTDRPGMRMLGRSVSATSHTGLPVGASSATMWLSEVAVNSLSP